MFEIGIVTHFEAAHRLRGDFGPATRLHGHTYRVEVAVRGPSLREDGSLCDMGALQRIVSETVSDLHYQELDGLPAFAGRNTTAEAVAHHIFQQVAPHLQGRGLAFLGVRIWESPQAWAAFESQIP